MMKKISVCSMFRDSQKWYSKHINQVDVYFANMKSQALDAKCELEFFLLEGDSKDDTYLKLEQYSKFYNINLIKKDIGGSGPSSCGSEQRRKILSDVGNACLIPAIKSDNDLIFWMESDLLPTPGMLKNLLAYSEKPEWEQTGLISPVALILINGCIHGFYDGWAFEGIDGEKWDLQHTKKFCEVKLREMKAIGCAALINANALRKHNITFEDGCFPRMCELLRENGFKLYCDSEIKIWHPSEHGCMEGRWI